MSDSHPPASAGLSLIEGLVLFALAAAAGAGALVWAGAALSALLIGGPPPGGLADGVRAIPALAGAPDDPAAAWAGQVGRPVVSARRRRLLGGDRVGGRRGWWRAAWPAGRCGGR